MNIVIVGAGEVGLSVAQTLTTEGHNVYVVERSQDRAELAANIDVQVITGNGARPQVLAKAGVVSGGDVDILIACTNKDEVNMLSCWIAHQAGVKRVISRARNLEFTDSPQWADKLGIDLMISPERSIAREVLGLLAVNAATHTAELLDGRASLYAMPIADNSPLVGLALKELRANFPDLAAVWVYIDREGGGGVPNGDSVLKAGDLCYFVTFAEEAPKVQKIFQPLNTNTSGLKKLFVVGGGKLGTQIVQAVKHDYSSTQIRLIEKDTDRSSRLSEELGEALILNADGADRKLLAEEGIDDADGYVCATDSDELNMIYCAIAHSMGARKTIAIVKRKDYQDLAGVIPVDAVVDPNDALAAQILRVVHYPKHTRAYSIIERINAEMLEVVMPDDNPLTGKTLAQIRLAKGVVIALVGRGQDVLIPTGTTKLEAGDHVIIFALTSMMPKAAKLFSGGGDKGED